MLVILNTSKNMFHRISQERIRAKVLHIKHIYAKDKHSCDKKIKLHLVVIGAPGKI